MLNLVVSEVKNIVSGEAQAITRLTAGDPARCLRAKGNYLLVRTHRTLGWVERAQLGLTCAPG